MAHATLGTGGRMDQPAVSVPTRWGGLAFLLVVGSAWHFVHAATGRSTLLGLVAPVNESVWEHTKLVAIPMLVWAVLVGWRTRRVPAALVAGTAGGSVGAVLMVAGYYAYVAVLGTGWFPMDLVLFVACALVALAVFERTICPASRVPRLLAVALAAAELAVFGALTLAPPDWPLFVPGVR
jgi:hypothetical protein